ncbi:hypothetical protein NP493_1167g00013 [Ridgeia piscesae]|uniref:Uncharacterized protein n=1 Tax=Ridgeia piscesae TaxID=27915 RepID=A0AAD9KE46_RIDPI|nr:hypothetical protein NP493_1167g00013 [Ridgeia piscesae]
MLLKTLVWFLFCVLLTDVPVASKVTEFRIGVILITGNGSPYDVKRSGAAVTLAVREVNKQVLNDSYRIVPIMRTYGPKCDANKAPGNEPETRVHVQAETLRLNHLVVLGGFL